MEMIKGRGLVGRIYGAHKCHNPNHYNLVLIDGKCPECGNQIENWEKDEYDIPPLKFDKID